jgi:hypothetical protein
MYIIVTDNIEAAMVASAHKNYEFLTNKTQSRECGRVDALIMELDEHLL